jgi:hypothetical protein
LRRREQARAQCVDEVAARVRDDVDPEAACRVGPEGAADERDAAGTGNRRNAPPQVFAGKGAAAKAIPAGSVSTRPIVVSASALALVLRMLIVSVDTPPTRTVAGLNDLFSVTLVTTRVMTALAAAGLVKPSADVTAPAAIVLVGAPAPAGVVMLTRIVQDVAATPPASDPPASETLPPAAVTTPPQLLTRLGVADTRD